MRCFALKSFYNTISSIVSSGFVLESKKIWSGWTYGEYSTGVRFSDSTDSTFTICCIFINFRFILTICKLERKCENMFGATVGLEATMWSALKPNFRHNDAFKIYWRVLKEIMLMLPKKCDIQNKSVKTKEAPKIKLN